MFLTEMINYTRLLFERVQIYVFLTDKIFDVRIIFERFKSAWILTLKELFYCAVRLPELSMLASNR